MAISLPRSVPVRLLTHGGFLAFWQVQSKIATLVMFPLIAVSVWLALAVMLVWSLTATVVYFQARQRGVPDLLSCPASTANRAALRTGQVLGAVWLVGFNAFAFANVVRPLLRRPCRSRLSHVSRGVVLGAGLTLFGVTMNQHMLQVAGFSGGRLLFVSTLGSFLNVPYRIFSGALTLHLLLGFISLQAPSRYI